MSSHSLSMWHSTSPISKLNSDVLREIFAMNTDENYGRIFLPSELQLDCKLIPLIITRRSSQVCQAWRDIILGSPSIWASCIDLDVLNQKDDCWRNIVLQRTGQAMLFVTGPNSCESEPEARRTSDCWKFVVKLLGPQEMCVARACVRVRCVARTG